MIGTVEAARQLAIALGLGLLVGLQRQRSAGTLSGIRTFALVTLLGAVCGQLAGHYGLWLVGAGLVGVAALNVVGNVMSMHTRHVDPGQTTEAALLLMYVVGAYLVVGSEPVGVALGVSVAVLLQLKHWLHGVARRIGDTDFRAIVQFVMVAAVVLPILPDRGYGPYHVWNPRQIWLMVVLISGISLAGYLAWKFVGQRAGTLLAGALGGVISSTATTVSYARRAAAAPQAVPAAALVVLVASAVTFARILLLIGATTPSFLRLAALPLSVLLVVFAALCRLAWTRQPPVSDEPPTPSNPAELKPALIFAAVYATVLLGVAWARAHTGAGALYGVAALSGIADVDAITLSTSNLVRAGHLDPHIGWRLITVAALVNLVFKALIAGGLGGRRLLRRIVLPFAIVLVVGVALILVMP